MNVTHNEKIVMLQNAFPRVNVEVLYLINPSRVYLLSHHS